MIREADKPDRTEIPELPRYHPEMPADLRKKILTIRGQFHPNSPEMIDSLSKRYGEEITALIEEVAVWEEENPGKAEAWNPEIAQQEATAR